MPQKDDEVLGVEIDAFQSIKWMTNHTEEACDRYIKAYKDQKSHREAYLRPSTVLFLLRSCNHISNPRRKRPGNEPRIDINNTNN